MNRSTMTVTIDTFIKQSCLRHSDNAALRFKFQGVWTDMSYGSLWTLSDRIAAGLIKNGFQPADHAAIIAPSSPNWVATYLGILKAGGVVVPIDKELKQGELRHILADCDATIVFTEQAYLDVLLEVIDEIPAISHCVLLNEQTTAQSSEEIASTVSRLHEEFTLLCNDHKLSLPNGTTIEGLIARLQRLSGTLNPTKPSKKVRNPYDSIETLRERFITAGKLLNYTDFCHEAPLPCNPRKSEDTAVILYTSGTTGRSKGAMLSHDNIVSNIQTAVRHFNLTDVISTLSFLPINHVFEQVCGVLLPLSLGGTVTFCESLKKLGDNLAEVKPNFFLAVPAVYRLLLDRIMKSIGAKKLSTVLFNFSMTRPIVTAKIKQAFGSGTIFVSGGAALDPAIVLGMNRLGLMIYQGYGITETSPIISAEQPGLRLAGTVGKVMDGIQISIDSPNNDGVGEILVKGPNVMQGYYKNPTATAEVLHDGWYRTGDLGRVDHNAMLSICGRLKNLIVTPNGKNVYPEEVEQELLKSPYIAEVMVYGHSVGPAVEEVHAVIYPSQEAIEEYCVEVGKESCTDAELELLLRNEVQNVCKELADYKKVRKFTIRNEEFPKTTTRKIKRYIVEASISTK